MPAGNRFSMLAEAGGLPVGRLLGGAMAALMLAVGLMAFGAIERSEKAMTRLMEEKGATLMRAFEGALRSSMRSKRGGLRLQILLEELASSPDIAFVALAMPDGSLIAHSDAANAGQILELGTELDGLEPGPQEKWLVATVAGQKVFVVYRQLSPGRRKEPRDGATPVIYLGLDYSPFDITRRQNRSYVLMLALVSLLGGMLGIAAAWFAQRARESRQGQRYAEARAMRLEEEVRRQEKMAAIGSLAAGVAHEIRNPLSSIKGYATYFGGRFPEGSADREAAEIMVREVSRLNRVVTDLIGLSKPGDAHLTPTNLEEVARHVLRLVQPAASRQNVRLEYRASRHLPEAMADAERLGQALLNLCLNALDAMPDGGTLTIAVARAKNSVCLMVRDNGKGIAREHHRHIFDPYFTTKGKGTGLGLAMVHKIVTAHNGLILLHSRVGEHGEGLTIFRIGLPRAGALPGARASQKEGA